jgi:hypothetical protein
MRFETGSSGTHVSLSVIGLLPLALKQISTYFLPVKKKSILLRNFCSFLSSKHCNAIIISCQEVRKMKS